MMGEMSRVQEYDSMKRKMLLEFSNSVDKLRLFLEMQMMIVSKVET